MHILADMTPLMTFLIELNHIDPPRIFFPNFGRKKFLITIPKFGHMRSFLHPKMREFGTFSSKMTYFDQIDPINDIFHQVYVQKTK